MPSTRILDPITDVEIKSEGLNNFQKIASYLSQMKLTDSGKGFESFLTELGIDEESYIYALRATLTTSKVFLKRNLEETRINNYNSILLESWEANMDIQYILDPYACISYIVSYISKGQRGLSNLLYEACKEAKAKDSDIRQQVRRIGNQFLSHVEIGAQEAAYLVLQMPLRRSSRDVVFIDTNKQENRTILLKPFSDLKEMLESSTNVESDSALKRYKRRPREMNKYCYADFVSWLEPVFLSKKGKQMRNVDSELPENDYSLDPIDEEYGESENFDAFSDSVFELKDGTVLRKRKKLKVLSKSE